MNRVSHNIHTASICCTHSLSSGIDVRLLVFCTMLAWFLREMWITDGASLQGSPSTCMGIDLKVVRVTSRHWFNRSPWPPTCSVAYSHNKQYRDCKFTSRTIKTQFKLIQVNESYQWCHRESNDLNAAIIMTLRLKVMMLAWIAPWHSARTVPAINMNIQTCKLFAQIYVELKIQLCHHRNTFLNTFK